MNSTTPPADDCRLDVGVGRLVGAVRTLEADHGPGGWPAVEMALLSALANEVERLSVGHDRYETARLMGPRQWADAWKLNMSTGKAFDEIIDELRPFLRPNAFEFSGCEAVRWNEGFGFTRNEATT